MLKTRALCFATLAALILLGGGRLGAQVFDEVTTVDGSHVLGTIDKMEGGKLTIKPAFGGDDVVIGWDQVKTLKTAKALPFVLDDGTTLNGVGAAGAEGNMDIKADALSQANSVPMARIQAINPTPKKPWSYKINLGFGGSVSDGNTRTKTMSTMGEFVARSERLRLTAGAAYNYAQDKNAGVTAQYGKGAIKFDFFLTKRLYLFASALFEHDGIQDLKLRTALSAGPGFQFVDKGDFEPEWLNQLEVYGEAGIAYFNEDYRTAVDKDFVAARWAFKVNWPFLPDRVTFFHFHEGYPSLENAKDLYITTETGLRFTVIKNFVATLQVNWRWDNTPSPGFRRSDTLYLATLGYNIDF